MARPRSNSAAAAIKAAEDAAKGPLKAPAHVSLRECDEPFWVGIMASRARDEWSDADLVVAAQLAVCQADIEAETKAIQGETTVVLNQRGTMVVNPRVMVLEQYARREMALMRTLRMGGRIAGDTRDEAGRRKVASQARKVQAELEEDALLA